MLTIISRCKNIIVLEVESEEFKEFATSYEPTTWNLIDKLRVEHLFAKGWSADFKELYNLKTLDISEDGSDEIEHLHKLGHISLTGGTITALRRIIEDNRKLFSLSFSTEQSGELMSSMVECGLNLEMLEVYLHKVT